MILMQSCTYFASGHRHQRLKVLESLQLPDVHLQDTNSAGQHYQISNCCALDTRVPECPGFETRA